MRPLFTSYRLHGLAGVALLVASGAFFLAVRLVYVYKGATYKCAVEGPGAVTDTSACRGTTLDTATIGASCLRPQG